MKTEIEIISKVEYKSLLDIKPQIQQYLLNHYTIRPGNLVAVKLNLVGPFHPEKAATTNPEMVRLLMEALQPFHCDIMLCEDIDAVDPKSFLEKCGIQKILDEYGLVFYNLRDYGYSQVKVGNKIFHYSNLILKSDFFFQIPKFKTHMLTGFTGAIKNTYGCIAKLQKKELHKEIVDAAFADLICSIYSIRQPDFVLMDAVVAMEGMGPSTGKPKFLGKVILGNDSVWVDYYITPYTGFISDESSMVERAINRGLTTATLNDVVFSGIESLEEKAPFAMPTLIRGKRRFKRFNMMFFNTIIRSYTINEQKCIRCGQCVKSCPFEAITWMDGRLTFQKNKCMLCSCCIELCPVNAIGITT